MKNKKSLGGQLIQAGVSLIPGVGQVLSPIVGMIDEQRDAQAIPKQAAPVQLNQNPFGKLRLGGFINDQFKQYSTGSHESGNDLTVDSNGNPNPEGQSSVQNQENAYKIDGKHYVFSDVLTKSGKTFSNLAAEINKKYPEARFQQDQRQALDFEMKQLSKENDVARSDYESSQKILGGTLDNGDPLVPPGNTAWQSQNIFEPKPFPNFAQLPTSTEKTYGAQNNLPESNTLALDNTNTGQEIQLGSNLNEASDRNDPLPKPVTPTNDILGPRTANAIGLVSKGIGLISSIKDARTPAENETLITPEYSRADKYMQEANVDYTQAKQDAQGISNLAGSTNRSLSSNVASFQGREQARFAALSDQLSRIAEAQNNAQSSLNLNKGQYESNKAVDTANRQYQNQQGNMQNQANSRFFDRTLMSDLSQIGSSFNEYAETQKVIGNNKEVNQFKVNQALAILNSKYPNVKITPDIMEKLKQGASIDDILKISI